MEYHKVIAFHHPHDLGKYGSEIIVNVSAHNKEVARYLLKRALSEHVDKIAQQECVATQGKNYPDLQLLFNCFFFKDAQYQHSDCIASVRRADSAVDSIFFKDADEVSFVANLLSTPRKTYIGKQNDLAEFQYYTTFYNNVFSCGISKLVNGQFPLALEWFEEKTGEELYSRLKQWHDASEL